MNYSPSHKETVLLPPVECGQYTSLRLTEHLALEEIRPSIGSAGDAYDNALMECITACTRPSASARASSTTALQDPR